ncbi:MAG: hypothetical protein CMO66_02810 [Verrucomicrobiales bacterium]|nr:hypothetical protein [Verrucomicrobiales bacterium]
MKRVHLWEQRRGIKKEKPGAALTAASTNGLVFRLMGHVSGEFGEGEEKCQFSILNFQGRINDHCKLKIP